MRKRSLRVVVTLGLAAGWPTGPVLAQEVTAPVVLSAQVSADQTTLTVTGLHLGASGSTALPTLSLGLTPLTVQTLVLSGTESTPDEVTALFPSTVVAGTYLLGLTRASDSAMGVFYLTVGAAGPSGPPGSAGAAGPAGPVGPQGPAGPAGETVAETVGERNTGFGSSVLGALTTGTRNSGFGYEALGALTTGTRNTALGYRALTGLVSGERNVAVGPRALGALTTASYNTGVGMQSLQQLTEGLRNTAVGYGALRELTGTAADNVALGYESGVTNTTGSNNIYIGHGGVASESDRVRIGTTQTETHLVGTVYAPAFSGDGSALTGLPVGPAGPEGPAGPVGPQGPAGESVAVTLGDGNTGFGSSVLGTVTGTRNSGFGYEALTAATSGDRNTAVGYRALTGLVSGERNVAVGLQALGGLTTASYNTGVGVQSLQDLTAGQRNTAVGYRALRGLTGGGADNVALGYEAGITNTTGSNNIYIGHGGVVSESDRVRIGTTQTETHLVGTVHAPAFSGDGSALTKVVAVYQ